MVSGVLCVSNWSRHYVDHTYCLIAYTITFYLSFFNLFSQSFFIPASNSDTDYTSSFNVNNNINHHQNYPRYSEGILFHNTASSTTTSVRNVLLHVTKTLTMFTFIHIMHSVFVSLHQWKIYPASTSTSRHIWISKYSHPYLWKLI